MAYRYLSSISVLAILAFAFMPVQPVTGQGPTTATQTEVWTPPRTPWGDPDLQGIWTSGTSTPLQRPGAAAGNSTLTDEEAAEFADELAFNLDRDRRDGGNAADVSRAYNEHWMDANRLRLTQDN